MPPSFTAAAGLMHPPNCTTVRAARRQRGQFVSASAGVVVPHRMVGASASAHRVPPMPDLHARVRLAAGGPQGDQQTREALTQALRAAVPGFLGIEMVYPDDQAVVYSAAPATAVQLFRQSYDVDTSGTYTLAGDAQAVEQVTTYEPVTTPRAAAAAGVIPPTPSLHDRVRAAAARQRGVAS